VRSFSEIGGATLVQGVVASKEFAVEFLQNGARASHEKHN